MDLRSEAEVERALKLDKDYMGELVACFCTRKNWLIRSLNGSKFDFPVSSLGDFGFLPHLKTSI